MSSRAYCLLTNIGSGEGFGSGCSVGARVGSAVGCGVGSDEGARVGDGEKSTHGHDSVLPLEPEPYGQTAHVDPS